MSDGGYSDDFEDDATASEEEEAPAAATASATVSTCGLGDFKSIRYDELELNQTDVIGGGGFALVYGGFFEGEAVACKALFDPRCDESLRQEFMDELLVMGQLTHPNVVELLGACIEPPKMVFVMERCDASLFATLHQGRCDLGTKARVQIGADVGRALAYMHDGFSPSLVHRDIKSHNVLLTRDGVAKLCDFGLVSAPQRGAGTPAYMAPELLSSRCASCVARLALLAPCAAACAFLLLTTSTATARPRSFSRKVDVYAFGVLLWELLARSGSPWIGFEPSDLRAKVLVGDRLDIPAYECPVDAQEMIAQCWAQAPGDRPEMAPVVRRLDELGERLFDSIGGGGGGFGEDDALAALMR